MKKKIIIIIIIEWKSNDLIDYSTNKLPIAPTIIKAALVLDYYYYIIILIHDDVRCYLVYC